MVRMAKILLSSTFLYYYYHHVLHSDSVLPPAVHIPTTKRLYCALDDFLILMGWKHHLNIRSANHHAVCLKLSDTCQLFLNKIGKENNNKVCLCSFLLTHLVPVPLQIQMKMCQGSWLDDLEILLIYLICFFLKAEN